MELMKKLKYAAIVVAALCASARKPKANVQRERLDKLNGKALGRVIYRGATLIDGTAARRAPTWPSSSRTTASKPSAGRRLTAQHTEGARGGRGGQYLLPGLIDSHVHYATNPDRPYAEAELKRNIYGGVTGVRDMAGDARELAGLSRDALLNRIPSPDMFYASLVAGPSFFKDPRTVVAALGTQPGTVPWLYAVDEQRCRWPSRRRGTGATGLKIYANLPGTLVRKLIAQPSAGFPGLDPHAGLPCHARFAGRDRRVPRLHDRAPCARSRQAAYGHGGEPSYEGLTAEDRASGSTSRHWPNPAPSWTPP
jgi:hypothetical protein